MMINQTMLNKVLYDPDALPYILLSDNRRILDKNDLLLSDVFLEEFRSSKQHIDIKISKLIETLDKIFKEKDHLLKIRTVLLLFSFKNIIDTFQILAYIIDEGLIDPLAEQSDDIDVFRKENIYFDDIFYHELSMHPVLMLDVIESIYLFFNEYSLQYDHLYVIANKIIITNEESLNTISSDKLNFMDERHIGDYKYQIMGTFPIILPFQTKYDFYLEEKPPAIIIKFHVDRNNILNTVWNLDSIKNVNIQFDIRFNGEGRCSTNEFIELAFKELCEPETDLFDLRNDYYWFKYHEKVDAKKSKLLKKKFYCIGILFGIVILNKNTIPIHFPPYFYKKLLHRDIQATDISIFDPVLFHDITTDLYNHDLSGDQSYDFTYRDNLGNYEIDLTDFRDITKDDEFIPQVLNEYNKKKYLQKVAEWVFDISIRDEFEAFEQGFHKVRNSPLLYYFRLDELDKIVSGSYQRNWQDLKKSAIYTDYKSNSKVIVWFWKFFFGLNEGEKINALKFITGKTSTPPNGLIDVQIEFKRIRGKGFPQADTRYHKIKLPQYDSYEQLAEQCDYAFNYLEAFGFP